MTKHATPSRAVRRVALRAGHAGPASVAEVMLAVIRLSTAPTTTVRDVADETGCSTSTTHAALVLLANEGLVSYVPGRSATIRPTLRYVMTPPWEPDPLRCLARSVLEPTEPERCWMCDGTGCEENCGARGGCRMAHAGPESHRVCRTCGGSGRL